jgi:hypothetical protein
MPTIRDEEAGDEEHGETFPASPGEAECES